jgi:hypothetical protein
MKKLATVIVTVAALAACNKAKESMAKYQDRAKALTAKYAPKVAELSKQLPGLAEHAKDLPVNVPGADKLAKLIKDNESQLKSAQELLDSLPKRLGTETPEQAEKELAEADKALSAEVTAAEDDEKQEAAIEAAAAPTPAPAK